MESRRPRREPPWLTFMDGFVRLMGDHTVEIPLWGPSGALMFLGPEKMVGQGFDPELVADLAQWARDWYQTTDELHLRAIALVPRVAEAFGGRYRIVYQP